jgi:cytochrome bd-type quinol oxidase subunit 2
LLVFIYTFRIEEWVDINNIKNMKTYRYQMVLFVSLLCAALFVIVGVFLYMLSDSFSWDVDTWPMILQVPIFAFCLLFLALEISCFGKKHKRKNKWDSGKQKDGMSDVEF